MAGGTDDVPGLSAEDLELLEPHPDIHALFCHFNSLYFGDGLGACSVEWSSARMTLCGGVCEWRPGGGCRIKLSEPLLKLRPSSDLKMVLLHEMIHAHCMLGGIRDDDPGGHGTAFKSIMQRINTSTLPDHQRPAGGYNITTTHSMLAEVDFYRQHHWRCERCGNLVKRAMNRPPQEADCRGRMGRGAACRDPGCAFHLHIQHCGGTWLKIKEPEGYGQKKKRAGSSQAGAGASGSNATRPDGAPLPAKRPKKAGGSGKPGGKADGAAGSRPITDFFPRSPPARGGLQREPEGSQGVLPAIAAVAGQQQQQQQQQQREQQQQQQREQPAEVSAEERRRLLAEAALRRLGGAAAAGRSRESPPPAQLPAQPAPRQQEPAGRRPPAAQQQQQQQQQPGGSIEVVDLLDSPGSSRGSDLDQPLTQRWQQQQQRHQAGGAPEPGGAAVAAAAAAAPSGSEEGGSEAGLQCPVCGQLWAAGSISNDALNGHIDECLTLSYLQEGQ